MSFPPKEKCSSEVLGGGENFPLNKYFKNGLLSYSVPNTLSLFLSVEGREQTLPKHCIGRRQGREQRFASITKRIKIQLSLLAFSGVSHKQKSTTITIIQENNITILPGAPCFYSFGYDHIVCVCVSTCHMTMGRGVV